MNDPALTTNELHKQLGKLIADGYGDRPVAVMTIDAGIPYRSDVTGCIDSQADDGELVWLFVSDPQPPEWFPNAG